MRYICFLLPLIILGNPILITYFNEIQVSPDSLERIELHTYVPGEVNLSGWQIVTSTGVATINPGVIIPSNGYAVIDRHNTTGVFSLNDESDSILLIDNEGRPMDMYKYPFLPRGIIGTSGPTPPYNGSVSFYRISITSLSFNWYIDSTPTFGHQNDNWSSISGRIIDQRGNPVPYVSIVASGPMGEMGYDRMGYPINEPFYLPGLGAGKYWLSAYLYDPRIRVSYPESINLGYNQHLTDINIIVPSQALEELSSTKSSNIQFYDIYDALGRKIESQKVISKGIYFLPQNKRIRKFIFYR